MEYPSERTGLASKAQGFLATARWCALKKNNWKNIKNIVLFLILTIGLASCGLSLTKSKALKEWTIDDYRITYSKKIGPVGPHYYQYDVYKNGKHLSYAASIIDNDSCLLRFREENDYYVDFNLCEQTKKILRPDKKEIVLKSIDSITIRPYDSIRLVPSGKKYPDPFYDTVITKNFDPTLVKKLNPREMNIFVRKWNKSEANGYNRLGQTYHYLLTVYANDSVRKIKTLNQFLTENGKWSFKSKEDDFFDELWNK